MRIRVVQAVYGVCVCVCVSGWRIAKKYLKKNVLKIRKSTKSYLYNFGYEYTITVYSTPTQRSRIIGSKRTLVVYDGV